MAEPMTAGEVAALLQEGSAALAAGDSYTARQRFRQVLDLDPNQVEAWIGMAGAVRQYREQREHLLRALALDPEHAAARAMLAQVDARLAAGQLLAPAPRLPATQATPAPHDEPLPVVDAIVSATPEALVCYNHPNRETGLRCTSCNRPICADCVRPAPVGQLCPECAKARRPPNYKVNWVTLLVAGAISLFYGGLVSYLALNLLSMVGFFALIITFMLGPLAGELLVRLLDRVTGNKRGRAMQMTVSISYGCGALPWLGSLLILNIFWPLLLLGLFTGLALTTIVARMR